MLGFVRRKWPLLTIQVTGYALVAALIYLWLGIPEQSVWQLLLSLLLAAAIIAGSGWLLAALFALRLCGRREWRRGMAFVLLLLVMFLGGSWLSGSAPRVNPLWLWGIGALIVFTVLPWFAATRAWLIRRWQYWVAAAGVVTMGIYIPWKLIWWVPPLSGMTAQTLSMAVRFGLAYLLLVASLLLFSGWMQRLSGEPAVNPPEHPLSPETLE
ncbi:MAG: hypothetical protein HUU41_01550 [Bryobacteraceae bacterium]|nr:hypothetical protein [Bryobacterales bacterium]MEB2359766.1 hypothetical protein [Bryobacterales bacterium]NUM99775.1 hypothetical protein [Bryobacteraceae bacterium]